MTLRQLRIFATVARHLNITRAAKELHISQPGVSLQLKHLEEECDVKFYQGEGRGIKLTREGLNILRYSQPILSQLDKLEARFNANRWGRKTNSLAVGGSHGPSVSTLPLALAAFRKSHAKAKITFRTTSSNEIERLVLNSEVDIGLVTHPCRSPSIAMKPYRREKLVLFAPGNDRLAKRRGLTLSDIAEAPLVIRGGIGEKGRTDEILKKIENRRLKFNIVMRCESPEAVKAAVKKKMGLGILYWDTVKAEVGRGDFKIIKSAGLPLEGTSFIIYHRKRPLSSDARDFLRLLQQQRYKGRKVR